MKLNQIIALVTGKKTRTQKLLTECHRQWDKSAISGISRTYQPKDEDGDMLPAEHRPVVLSVKNGLSDTIEKLSDFYNLVYSLESGNQSATSEILIDGLLLPSMPVTFLLFLEKQLNDLRTLALNLPILPSDKEWTYNDNKGCFVAKPEETSKTQKKAEVLVKYEATKEHPAQTEVIGVDKIVGTWTTVHLSGALPKDVKDGIVERIEKLQDAVKVAREQANSIEVSPETALGQSILQYIFKS